FAAPFIATLSANNSFIPIPKAAISSVNGTMSLYLDILCVISDSSDVLSNDRQMAVRWNWKNSGRT
ncbi:MAG: hypothetical protein ACJ72U_17390, partial [Nitrososphaeraceae archaeon]